MDIIEATPSHLEDILRLNMGVQQMHVEHEPDYFRPFERNAVREFFSPFFEDRAVTILLAMADGRTVGYAVVRIYEKPGHAFALARKYAELDQITVDPAYRGRGFGRALVERAIAVARDNGCRSMELGVWEFNQEAQSVFRHCGFEPCFHRMRVVDRDNED